MLKISLLFKKFTNFKGKSFQNSGSSIVNTVDTNYFRPTIPVYVCKNHWSILVTNINMLFHFCFRYSWVCCCSQCKL